MKKNLTKIITAVLTGTLAVSGTGAFAFTDMADTENSILAERLRIISGYEDGSFHPDNEVTRAEAATIVVNAMGLSQYGIIDTFADYNPNHWANSFLKMAVGNNVLSGFDDNTLRPDENVTLAQIFTMLLNSIGYSTYAQAEGGYPNGYVKWAENTGITDDLGSYDFNKNATRKEVMDCVVNAIEAPICVIDGFEPSFDGMTLPVLKIKDSEGSDYQTMLTYNNDIYKVNGHVNDINNSTVKVNITDARNFDDELITSDNPVTVDVEVSEKSRNDIEKDKNYTMYIAAEDYGEKSYELICAFPSE